MTRRRNSTAAGCFAMLNYISTVRKPRDLSLGCTLKHVTYSWKPFHKRPVEHQADYTRLLTSMINAGAMVNPLIVFQDSVLIGQRRCEIAQNLGWDSVPCWEITTDITDDASPDRVLELRDQYKKVSY